jgi:hypothetical protein
LEILSASGSPSVIEGKPEGITVVGPQIFALGVNLDHSNPVLKLNSFLEFDDTASE